MTSPAPPTPDADDLDGTAHMAGIPVTVDGHYLRQRCSWCGTILIDYDLAAIAVPIGQDPTPATWPVGADVLVEHGDPDGRPAALTMTASSLLERIPHPDNPELAKLPPNACARLDPELTR